MNASELLDHLGECRQQGGHLEYEAAVKALEACCTLEDEARSSADKSAALAMLDQAYRSNDAGRKAKQRKLHEGTAHHRWPAILTGVVGYTVSVATGWYVGHQIPDHGPSDIVTMLVSGVLGALSARGTFSVWLAGNR